jgi:hypothetical protein
MANIFYTFNSSQSLIIIKFSLNVLKQILQFFPIQPYLYIFNALYKISIFIFINDLILKLIYTTKFQTKIFLVWKIFLVSKYYHIMFNSN